MEKEPKYMRNVYVNRDHEYVSETRICVLKPLL